MWKIISLSGVRTLPFNLILLLPFIGSAALELIPAERAFLKEPPAILTPCS